MRLKIFVKLFAVLVALSLFYFGMIPDADLTDLAKFLAIGCAISITASIIYPEIRGIKAGDTVSVVSNSTPVVIGRTGTAVDKGKKNDKIRVRFGNGSEALGIVESYSGVFSPPRIRAIYEEIANV
ncbi:MAG: hypothetical protein ABII22_02665 [Candidatus Micrarchaeota archaeon]